MSLICLHPRFTSLSSHHFNESLALQAECRRRGLPFVLYMSVHAPAELALPFDGRRVFDDPTFRMEWSYAERVERFGAQLHAQLDADVRSEDRVLLTVATQVETLALLRWRQTLPPARRPWLVILILSDRWNRSTPAEYERQMAEYAHVRAELAQLPAVDAQRVLFFTLTELLAQELAAMLGTAVAVAPVPLDIEPPPAAPRTPRTRPRVAALGGLRREKGSHLLPAIVHASAARVDVDFVLQVYNNALGADELAAVERLADAPNVQAIRSALTFDAYRAALSSADLALFPYEVVPYRKRNSGVFAEAVAYGKPVLATGGTWMAEQIDAGRAAGIVFESLEPDAIADALARAVADLPALQAAAVRLAPAWRAGSGMPGFFDLMERGIAARATAA